MMADYDHICSIRGVDQKLLNYLADKTGFVSMGTRYRGEVVNEALRLMALLYVDQSRTVGNDFRRKPMREEDVRALLGDLLDKPRPWSPLGRGGAGE